MGRRLRRSAGAGKARWDGGYVDPIADAGKDGAVSGRRARPGPVVTLPDSKTVPEPTGPAPGIRVPPLLLPMIDFGAS
jgi:hypothetical protein